MLLEYDGIWGEKAFKESKLPELVKSYLGDLLDQIPSSKLLLIRQHLAHRVSRHEGHLSINYSREGVRFYLAIATEQEPLLYAFHLKRYEDLLDLDIPVAVARRGGFEANLSDKALILVCTNGRRDWCCARYGPGIYQEAVEAINTADAQLAVWQSSHLGGHRFAPNIACFPQGLFYGRIEKDELPVFLEHIRQGQVYAAKARGRACYPAPVQAAEIFLRQRAESLEPVGYRLVDVKESKAGEWTVRFISLAHGRTHSLEIRQEIITDKVFKSCNDPVPAQLVFYKLVG
jgi:hypothetical protein